jgi:hypothetical protein
MIAAIQEAAMKPVSAIAVAIFAIVAVVHLHRLFTGWAIVINGFSVPVWWSLPGVIFAAGLAFLLWREARS